MDFAAAVYHAVPRGWRGDVRVKSYAQFLRVARGSLNEAETHILLAARLELIEAAHAAQLLRTSEAISKMLNGLIKSIAKWQ